MYSNLHKFKSDQEIKFEVLYRYSNFLIFVLQYSLLCDFIFSPLLIYINEYYRYQLAGFTFLQLFRGILFGIFVLCIAGINLARSRRLMIFNVILLLGLYSVILTMTTRLPKENILGTIRLIYPALLGIATYIAVSKDIFGLKTFQCLAWYWLLVYFLSQLFALYSGNTIYNSMYAVGGLGSTGSAADALIFLIPYFFLSIRLSKLDFIAVSIAIISTSLTMRRTAILGVLLSFMFGFTARAMKKGSGKTAKLQLVLCFAVVMFGFIQALHSTGWGEEFSLRLLDNTGSGRTYIWVQGIEHLKVRGLLLNLLGEGEGSYTLIMLERIGFIVGAHNGWLNLVIAYGAVGIFFYLAFFTQLWRLLKESLKLPGSSFAVLAALMVGILVAETTQGFLLSPSAVSSYVLIGFLLAQNKKIIQKINNRLYV